MKEQATVNIDAQGVPSKMNIDHENGAHPICATEHPLKLNFFLKERCVSEVCAKITDISCFRQEKIEIVTFLSSFQKKRKKYKQKCKNCIDRPEMLTNSTERHILAASRQSWRTYCINLEIFGHFSVSMHTFSAITSTLSCPKAMKHISS